MPDTPGTKDSIELLRHDHTSMASTLGVLTRRLDDVERGELDPIRDKVSVLERANDIRIVEDRHLNDRLDRIEASLKAVYSLGKWLLATVGSVLVVAVVGFILKGGPLG